VNLFIIAVYVVFPQLLFISSGLEKSPVQSLYKYIRFSVLGGVVSLHQLLMIFCPDPECAQNDNFWEKMAKVTRSFWKVNNGYLLILVITGIITVAAVTMLKKCHHTIAK
jgi:hypothetical protein